MIPINLEEGNKTYKAPPSVPITAAGTHLSSHTAAAGACCWLGGPWTSLSSCTDTAWDQHNSRSSVMDGRQGGSSMRTSQAKLQQRVGN